MRNCCSNSRAFSVTTRSFGWMPLVTTTSRAPSSAARALAAGADGVIASPQEAALIRLDALDQRERLLDLGFARVDLRTPDEVAVRPAGEA